MGAEDPAAFAAVPGEVRLRPDTTDVGDVPLKPDATFDGEDSEREDEGADENEGADVVSGVSPTDSAGGEAAGEVGHSDRSGIAASPRPRTRPTTR